MKLISFKELVSTVLLVGTIYICTKAGQSLQEKEHAQEPGIEQSVSDYAKDLIDSSGAIPMLKDYVVDKVISKDLSQLMSE